MPVETLRSHLARLRARYREVLRAEIANTVSNAGDVEGEIRHLFAALAG